MSVVWKVKTGHDRRIRTGHPWLFSNELEKSPKGLKPGTEVILQDSKGGFIAAGYGNPNSLIAFRALSFNNKETEVCNEDFLQQKISYCWGQRFLIGCRGSFRMVYGEGDFLPGIVIDRYEVLQNEKKYQVLAVQILTYGMQEILKSPLGFFERLVTEAKEQGISEYDFTQTAVVIRNDVNVRKLEGLQYEEPQVLKAVAGLHLTDCDIILNFGQGQQEEVLMSTDLIEGQKTGFFLDQSFNIDLVISQIQRMDQWDGPIRILDLCCYVGQWSTKMAYALKKLGYNVEVTAVDVSEKALEFAKRNIERQGALTLINKLDVLEQLNTLPDRYFDIVIADPPAFIKAKKDVPVGKHAYLKLNGNAFKLVKRGGLVVSCSCSGLLEEAEFIDVLRKASRRGDLLSRCLTRGGHAADHPVQMGFPEGFYLKMFLHQVI
jgi:23S rRNA (cytosine1962-C5)-methyltransferase